MYIYYYQQSVLVLIGTSKDVCYRCKKIGFNLTTPCGDIECTIHFHQECINEQIIEGKNKCDGCDQPIVITKKYKFKQEIYYNKILMILITSALFIICVATPGLLIFGTSVFNKTFMIENVNSGWIIGSVIAIVIAIIFDFVIIWYLCFSFYFDDYYYIKISDFTWTENRNRRYLIIKYFLLFIIYSAIIIYHFLGFLILKFIFDMGIFSIIKHLIQDKFQLFYVL